MGHYIGDGSQPLHDTTHHDGWQGPDPKDTPATQDPWRFESQYVDAISLTEDDIVARIGKPGHLSATSSISSSPISTKREAM